MVSLHVEDVHFRLKCRHAEFVHDDIGAIELQTAHTVSHVCVPPEAISAEVEQLHITVVVAGSQASLHLVISISKGDGPAIRLDWLVF